MNPLDPRSVPHRDDPSGSSPMAGPQLQLNVECLKLALLVARYYAVPNVYQQEVAALCQQHFWQQSRWDQFDILQMITLRMPLDGDCTFYLGKRYERRLFLQRPASLELNYQRVILRCLPAQLALSYYRRWVRKLPLRGTTDLAGPELHRIPPPVVLGEYPARDHLEELIVRMHSYHGPVARHHLQDPGHAHHATMRLIVYYYLHWGSRDRKFAEITSQVEEYYACGPGRTNPDHSYYALALGYIHCF